MSLRYVQGVPWDSTLDQRRISDGKSSQGIYGILSKCVSELLSIILILITTGLILQLQLLYTRLLLNVMCLTVSAFHRKMRLKLAPCQPRAQRLEVSGYDLLYEVVVMIDHRHLCRRTPTPSKALTPRKRTGLSG